MFRIVIGVVFLVLATLAILEAIRVGPTTSAGTVLLNLGTEIIGIVITVAVVDWLFERRRHADEAKKLAWRVLHDLDHAVWVWQGGRRDLALDELLGLISSIGDNDPIPSFTSTLLLRLGSAAEITCRHQSEVVSVNRDLEKSLGQLAKLAALRDPNCTLSTSAIRWHLWDAALNLAATLDLDRSVIAKELIAPLRDPSEEAQEWRHYGHRVVVSSPPSRTPMDLGQLGD
ncbi:MAG TPA: hypothetical protein VLK66_15965 [Longimicrobium sp.]|nr:hypothetical protein [Longimicrobium sp.]